MVTKSIDPRDLAMAKKVITEKFEKSLNLFLTSIKEDADTDYFDQCQTFEIVQHFVQHFEIDVQDLNF